MIEQIARIWCHLTHNQVINYSFWPPRWTCGVCQRLWEIPMGESKQE